ncbi:HD domain-containing protein [soil metagenome]|nr:HDIG domain-containing protein [Trueperaceae bacterium]
MRARLGPVKRVRWLLNVVPRTARAFLPGLARPDDAFAREVLSAAEYELYLAMDRRDRHHGVAVARAVLALAPDAERLVVRAALLHDVGKSIAPYRAWERIAVHLYTPPRGVERRAGRWTEIGDRLDDAWRRHRDHAERGAALIRDAGGDHGVADIVARHHRADALRDPRVALIARADEGR